MYREEAREYFKTRRVFRDLDPRCFDAFIQDCLIPADASSAAKGGGGECAGRVCLAFPPDIEAMIYRKFPLDLHPSASQRLGQYELPGRSSSWGWLLYSTTHAIISEGDVAYLRGRFPSLQFAAFQQVGLPTGTR